MQDAAASAAAIGDPGFSIGAAVRRSEGGGSDQPELVVAKRDELELEIRVAKARPAARRSGIPMVSPSTGNLHWDAIAVPEHGTLMSFARAQRRRAGRRERAGREQ